MIKKAILDDAIHFSRIREYVHISNVVEVGRNHRGFLLGSSFEEYQDFIENAYCLVAQKREEIVGFGIVLPNNMFKKTEIWQNRKTISWRFNFDEIEQMNIAYFEQLAFLPQNQILVLKLVVKMLEDCFSSDIEIIFTTVVKLPIPNLASPPLILGLGGELVANIDENYPYIGNINSDIYMIKKENFYLNEKRINFEKRNYTS